MFQGLSKALQGVSRGFRSGPGGFTVLNGRSRCVSNDFMGCPGGISGVFNKLQGLIRGFQGVA